MKNIINWSFGAFFRTIGRVLAYLLIGFLLAIVYLKLGLNFGYMKVNASTSVNQWSEHLPDLTRVNMYECGSSACYDKTTDFGGIESSTGTGDRKYVFSSSKLTVDKSGGTVIQTTTGDVVNAGYLYLTKFYICFGNSISSYNYKIGTAAYSTPSTFSSEQVMINDLALSTSPGISSSGFSSCRLFSGLYVPKTSGNNWLSIQFTSNTTQTTKFNLIAVETEELGLYTETIKSIVNSSNGQVVDAVDQVKEETKKTNDLISDTSDPNTEDSISDWSSKMSDNPLESVVMLPLNVLNSIQSGLSGTCSALNVPVPFIDETLNIPCISTIFSQIEGLTELWNTIGTIVAAIMLYQYLIYLYNWIDDTISLKTKRMQGWGSV